ncbi:MAG TPA: photosynthetic reaction center cytochrome c subunit family protein [Vicinamibacterales bacterium]|nr:photosynthetic reaction center cytochrome c subunit family protein [Vicinamibacterales bacterium]
MRFRVRSGIATTAALWLLSASLVGGQASQGARPPMAEEVFKNIQVLRGIPVDQFMGTMGFFSAALGMNCTDCHVDESGGNWAKYSDDNDLKRTARRMVQMVAGINKGNFAGRQVVTCNTCHRGGRRPNVMPSLTLLYGSPPPDEPGEPIEQAAGQPAAEQVLDRYLQAVGGPDRLAKLTTLVAKGTYKGFDDADKSPLEVFASAPGQRTTIVHTLNGDSTTVVGSGGGWIAAPEAEKPVPLLAITGQELDGVRLEASLLFPGRIKEALSKWRVGPAALVDDRETLVVQGTTAGGGTVTLCFDAKTALLVRLVRFSESPVGRLVTRVDYDDYRDVAGVKIPFKWTVSWLSGRSLFELSNVQPNVAIDAARFARPTAARR